MNVNDFTQAVVEGYENGVPVFGWGPPGVGKSAGVAAAARILQEKYYPEAVVKKLPKKDQPEAKFGLLDIRLSLREPADLAGVMWPDPATKTVGYFAPSFLPKKGRGILFLDEFVQGVQMMQNCASQLVLDRALGEYCLPEGWYVCAAGNQMGHRAATNAMPTHIKNRFIHLYVEVDHKAWIDWALANDVDIRVVAFLKFRAALLHQFDPQMKGEAFPTPRSWEYVSKVVKGWKSSKTILEKVVKGAVGEGAGSEFFGFLQVADKIPSIDGILMNPKSAPIPDDMGALHATTTALVHRASRDNLANVTAYFNRVADTGKPDFAMAAIKELTARKDGAALTQTRAFIEFAAKYSHLMS